MAALNDLYASPSSYGHGAVGIRVSDVFVRAVVARAIKSRDGGNQ